MRNMLRRIHRMTTLNIPHAGRFQMKEMCHFGMQNANLSLSCVFFFCMQEI